MKNKNIYILPTHKPSRLFKNKESNLFSFRKFEDKPLNNNIQNQNICITNDEEIKVGDWVLETLNGVKFKVKVSGNDYSNSTFKRIILTTDQDLIADGVQAIDDTFLEWFVKNPSCEEVEVIKHVVDMSIYVDDIEKCNDTNYVEYEIIIPNKL